MIKLYSSVKTKVTKNGIPKGYEGIIVYIYENPLGYEVEIQKPNNKGPLSVETYEPEELEQID